MVEFIRQIPGPVFIWLFLAFSLLCIVLTRVLTDADGSASHAPVDEAGLDPVAVAVLQGGADSVIRSRVFSLMNQGLVVIENAKKKTRIQAAKTACPSALSPLDREILQFLSTARTPTGLFRNKGFMARIDSHLADVKAGLERRHLIRGEAQVARAGRIALFFGLMIASLGGLKLYLGVTHGKPVAFLVIALLIPEAVLILIFKSGKRLTRGGREFMKALRKRFKWTLKQKTLPKGIDPALLVALFGAGHLYISSLYPQFTEAFNRSAAGPSGCSGGCGGGGCSGGSSGGCGGCGGD